MTDDDNYLIQEEEHTLLSASDLRCEVTGLAMFHSHGWDVDGVESGVVYISINIIIGVYNISYIPVYVNDHRFIDLLCACSIMFYRFFPFMKITVKSL